ncbi:MAG: hypothetical protein A2603_05145 [Bdellovibrionales bacterium RIFOXYD1_FULL_55_31]|nr:MAG: hypothetical protein A2603_05145 [Bdellovibrionales bacterium RIFOXYD1_FULL_55_31]
MKERDFFKLMNTKLAHPPSDDFDRRFWANFKKEFNSASEMLSIFEQLARMALKPVAVAAVLLAVAGGSFWLSQKDRDRQSSADLQLVSTLMSQQGFLDDFEMLEELGETGVMASDEDWESVMNNRAGESRGHS